MADLITQGYLTAALAGYGHSAAQVALYPSVAAAASRLVRDWCGRRLERGVRDQLFAHDGRSPILLKEYPVHAVARVSGSPETVLTVRQADAATNQRAAAALATTGDAETGLVATGLTLARVASGVATSTTLAFAANVTLQALAASVAGVGGGWSATVAYGREKWASADLRPVQGPRPALAPHAAEFAAFVEDLPFDLDDPEAGLLVLGDPFGSPRDGWCRPSAGPVRVVYDAGFSPIPETVQVACVEVAKGMLDRFATDSTLASETNGSYGYATRDLAEALPPAVLASLALFRSARV